MRFPDTLEFYREPVNVYLSGPSSVFKAAVRAADTLTESTEITIAIQLINTIFIVCGMDSNLNNFKSKHK